MTARMTLDDIMRLPRHPDWKHELIEAEFIWSWRPWPLGCARATTAVLVQSDAAEVHPLARDDLTEARELLVQVWQELMPYRSARTRDEAIDWVRRDVGRCLLPLVVDGPVAGLVARQKGKIVGVVLLERVEKSNDYFDRLAGPQLSSLTVAREVRRQGVARSLLAGAIEVARSEAHDHVLSSFSAASIPGIMWHLRSGFEVLPGYHELRYDEDRPWIDMAPASN